GPADHEAAEPLEGRKGGLAGVRVAADGLRQLLAEVVHGRQHRGVDQRLGRAVVVADRGEVGARGRDDVAGGGVRVALLPQAADGAGEQVFTMAHGMILTNDLYKRTIQMSYTFV